MINQFAKNIVRVIPDATIDNIDELVIVTRDYRTYTVDYNKSRKLVTVYDEQNEIKVQCFETEFYEALCKEGHFIL
jgi:Flp pilus assembly secretin CpaC